MYRFISFPIKKKSFGFIVNTKKFLELLCLAEKSEFTKENIRMSFHIDITAISPFNPSIAIEKSNVRPSIENLENCPERDRVILVIE